MEKTEKVTAEEPSSDKYSNLSGHIAWIPALIVTGLIIIPLFWWVERLELEGKINPPKWLVMPIVFAIISFFGLVYGCVRLLIEWFLDKFTHQKAKSQKKESLMMSEKDVVPSNHADVSTVPKGIGGWLIIPAIGLILGPIKAVVLLFMGINMIQSVAPELLSDVRLWASGVIDVAIISAAIGIAVLFFQERRIAVRAIIGLMAASIFANLVQVFLNAAMFEKVDVDTIKPVVHACVFAAIWIPYFIKSKRVKNTFVN